MGLLKHCFTVTTLLKKVRWLRSEDDEPAVKISSIITVLSLTMQPYRQLRTHYANGLLANIFVGQFVVRSDRVHCFVRCVRRSGS